MKKGMKGKSLYFFDLFTAIIIAFTLSACVNDQLTPYSDAKDSLLTNNKLKLKGRLCNQEPGNVVLPIKILFVLDHSGSLGPYTDVGTDPDQSDADGGSSRQLAVRSVLDTFGNNPAYWFGQILFSSVIETCPNIGSGTGDNADLEFLNMDRAGYEPCIQMIQDPHNNTRMFSGLLKAYEEIEEDLNRLPAREQRRTTYIVILFTDGVPDDGDADCEGGIQQPGQPSEAEQEQNITNIAVDIMKLADEDNDVRAKEIIINTVFLNHPSYPPTRWGACPWFDAPSFGRNLLRTIASIGNGIFFETGAPTDLDFLQFVRTNVKSIFATKSFIAANLNARISGEGELVADSDADGLVDEYESKRGFDPRVRDEDGDGLGDGVEILLGKNVKVDDSTCDPATEFMDTDRDGLNDCEERYLGTDDQLPDSDGDGILDFLEIAYNTDPLIYDAINDYNQDGVANGYEIALHTEPGLSLTESIKERYAYRYTLNYASTPEEQEQLIDCYDFEIGNISLVRPLPKPNLPDGLNDILIYYIESLTDDPEEFGDATIGHYQAIYVGSGYKYPQSGQFEIEWDDFNVINKFFKVNGGF